MHHKYYKWLCFRAEHALVYCSRLGDFDKIIYVQIWHISNETHDKRPYTYKKKIQKKK